MAEEKVVYLVPGLYDKENPWFYCNYARMNPYEERCLLCQNDCKHKGKHTVLFVKGTGRFCAT